MSVEELVATLRRETLEERERILAKARREAADIVERARAEAEEHLRGPASELAVRLASERSRILQAARLEMRTSLTRIRRKLLEEATRRALERAERSAGGEDWRPILGDLMVEAAGDAGTGVFTVRPVDLAAARDLAAAMEGSFTVEQDGGMPPGVRFRTPDGRLETDNTIPIRLARHLALHEDEVAAVILGDWR